MLYAAAVIKNRSSVPWLLVNEHIYEQGGESFLYVKSSKSKLRKLVWELIQRMELEREKVPARILELKRMNIPAHKFLEKVEEIRVKDRLKVWHRSQGTREIKFIDIKKIKLVELTIINQDAGVIYKV